MPIPFKLKISSRPNPLAAPYIIPLYDVAMEVDGKPVELGTLLGLAVKIDAKDHLPVVTLTFCPPPGAAVDVDLADVDVEADILLESAKDLPKKY